MHETPRLPSLGSRSGSLDPALRGPATEILFGPDMWLGSHVEHALGMGPERGRGLELWPGECHVHAGIRVEDVNRARDRQPGSELLIHPECGCVPDVVADEAEPAPVKVLSTGQMLDEVRRHPEGCYVVATETGMLHPLRKAAPGVLLNPANEQAVCKYMKMITLPGLRDSLREIKHVVEVPDRVAERARAPIERMVAIGR